MSDENRLLKRLRNSTVKYLRDGTGKIVGIESADGKLTITPGNSAPMGSCAWSNIIGKPSLFPTTWTMIEDRPSLFSGSYSDLTDKPSQFSGRYADLQGLPALFDGQWASITGKPSFFSGSYNDLTDKPSIPVMPSLAMVASTGKYSDLTGLPTLFNGTWSALTGKPNLFSGSYADLTNKPDTVSTAALNTALAAKADAASVKRIDTYIGKTDANGLYTVTYATPFTAIPSIQPEPPAMANQVWVKVNSTTTGFSIRLLQRNTTTILGLEVLLGATVNVANTDARVVVIAQ